MMVLIIGGSASGKSELCENIAVRLGKKKLYVATMRPFGSEAQKRINRHIALRRGKGFDSIDCYTNILKIANYQNYDTVVIECMSNLVANEMFEENGNIGVVFDHIQMLKNKFKHLFVVSNDVFSDGTKYSKDTMEYIKNIGEINVKCAALADVVIEVVAEIPIVHKGRELVEKYI